MDSQLVHRAALEAALLELDGAWTLLAGVRLGGTGADYLLLHPQHGAALVDLAPGRRDAVRALRAFLEEQDFARFFAGTLPVVHLTLEPGADCELRRRLGVAFAASEPTTIANPEWAKALAALVAAAQSRGAWLGAPTPADDSAQPDATEAHFAAKGSLEAAAAPGIEKRDDDATADDATADDAAPARENLRDLAPRMPRWQTVAAFASLAAFGMLYLTLPGEAPRAPPATVEVAVAPQGGSGSSAPAPSIAEAPQPAAVPHATPRPPATQSPGPGALPPAPPHAAAETPVTVAATPPPPGGAPPPQAPPPAPDLAQPSVDAASVTLPEVVEAAPPAEDHVPANELAVNALPPPPPRRPAPPHAAAAPAPLADAAEPQAEPAVQPVSDLIHRSCRVYSSRVTVLGAPAEVRGFACQAADGSWQIMSEAPAAAH